MKYILKSSASLLIFLLLYDAFNYLKKVSDLFSTIGLLFLTPAFMFLLLSLLNRRYARKPVRTSLFDVVSFFITYIIMSFSVPFMSADPGLMRLVIRIISFIFIFITLMSFILWLRDLDIHIKLPGQK